MAENKAMPRTVFMNDLLCRAKMRQLIVVVEMTENAAPAVNRYSAMESETLSGSRPAA
jgi:hypothetical protein